ncbi:hypothetical protein Lp90_0073 [Lactiplantibacillus plantarum]|nr:hypothetical protein Lp90_0073 [Lactiplantibacillus plantarum]
MVIANYLNRTPTINSYELARYQPYRANLLKTMLNVGEHIVIAKLIDQ